MKIIGTIIITDPRYIFADSKDELEGKEILSIDNSIFTDYVCGVSKVGDGRWKVSEMIDVMNQQELEKFVEDIESAYYEFYKNSGLENQIRLEDLISKRKTVGRFSTNERVNNFGVFLLDEVLEFYPEFLSDYGDWCYTIIRDFKGNIELFEDENNQTHILGIGNKSIYSNTVSWL